MSRVNRLQVKEDVRWGQVSLLVVCLKIGITKSIFILSRREKKVQYIW